MSGRDWRRLVTKHREKALPFDLSQGKDKESLVNSFVSGSRHPKRYTEVDYDQLLSVVRERRDEGLEQSVRMERLTRRGHDRKKASILKEHRQAWIKSWKKLKEKAESLQDELDKWLTVTILSHSDLLEDCNILEQFTELQKSQSQFKQTCHSPVITLRKKLCNIKKSKPSKYAKAQTNEELKFEIERINCSQKETQLALETEWVLSSDELKPIRKEVLSWIDGETVSRMGVAEEVWSLECPDEKLRQFMTQEFENLDEHYKLQIDRLDSQLEGRLLNDSWSSVDELHFDHIFDQYESTERSLCIDRMLKEMPHRTRQDIVSYEMQYCGLKYYKKQFELVTKWWKERRQELIEKTKQCYEQAREEWRERQQLEEAKLSHQQMCLKLVEKVAKWRQDCLARQEEEEAMAARHMSELRAVLEEDEKREREKRNMIKEQLEQFHSEQEGLKRKRMECERERIQTHKERMQKQLLVDKERTAYRSHLYDVKVKEQVSQREELEKASLRKEERLERLRRQVRIEAAADTDRLISETEASKAHSLRTEDDTSSSNKSLFPLHSFTSDKILADKRLRVSEALRDVGLLSTDYARQILAKIPPPLPPRPDQHSSLFK